MRGQRLQRDARHRGGQTPARIEDLLRLVPVRGRAHDRLRARGVILALEDPRADEDGFRTERRNARDKLTNTRYQTWGSPSYEHPIGISEPGGVATNIARDAFGKPLAMTRSGSWNGQSLSLTRHYLYDDHQRLCANGEPESDA